MREREVYPGAPIVLAAVEVRHSLCEPLDPSGVSRINAGLAELLPLRGEVQSVSVAFQPGGAASPAQLGVFPRWSSRDKRTAVTVRSDALVIETTNYQQYENLRRLVELVLDARTPSAGAVGIERVGLRYIDEIRVPSDDSDRTITWAKWVHPSLLGPVVDPEHAAGMRLTDHQAIAVFTGADDQTLALRYGPREGYAIVSSPELRRPTPAPGPFFLLDIDSFWQPSQTAPALDTESVLSAVDRLHMPVRDLFEGLITARLREEVLRGE
jgi:uncharacterized protein (TIGR04255 family)